MWSPSLQPDSVLFKNVTVWYSGFLPSSARDEETAAMVDGLCSSLFSPLCFTVTETKVHILPRRPLFDAVCTPQQCWGTFVIAILWNRWYRYIPNVYCIAVWAEVMSYMLQTFHSRKLKSTHKLWTRFRSHLDLHQVRLEEDPSGIKASSKKNFVSWTKCADFFFL